MAAAISLFSIGTDWSLRSPALLHALLPVRSDVESEALALGLAVAAMALFLAFTGFGYFAADRQSLLTVARFVEQLIPILP